ncbi:hypothetical protein [Nitrosomonas nitrosa]|uniref:hypothetical protein n=1 Tax=Nitrosomonas nitrosa TaxID=52442 RepID=UPI000D3198CB|nr:hypothetical protein [Nitrosomonas nitrosa]
MFDQFLLQGSFLSVAIMVYTNSVMFHVATLNRIDPHGLYFAPLIFRHPIAVLFFFAAIPCAIWPSIYIGLYDGWIAGLFSWFILQIGLAVILPLIRGFLIGIHFIVACMLYPFGYYLSISSLL